MQLYHFKSSDGYEHFVIVHKNEEKARNDIGRIYDITDLELVGERPATVGTGVAITVNQ